MSACTRCPVGGSPQAVVSAGVVYATCIYVDLRLWLRAPSRPHKGHTCQDSGPLLQRAGAQEERKRGLEMERGKVKKKDKGKEPEKGKEEKEKRKEVEKEKAKDKEKEKGKGKEEKSRSNEEEKRKEREREKEKEQLKGKEDDNRVLGKALLEPPVRD